VASSARSTRPCSCAASTCARCHGSCTKGRGARARRRCAPWSPATVTDNDLEELLLAIIRRAGLPDPICQHPFLEYTADFAWPAHRVIAEADGGTHDTPSGRRRDARRDDALQNAGWRVLRFPKREIVGDPAYVERALTRALGR
jgi:very-short-patch-repair endonuclease